MEVILNDVVLLALFFSHSYVGPDYSVQKNTGKIALEHIDAVSPLSLLSSIICWWILI